MKQMLLLLAMLCAVSLVFAQSAPPEQLRHGINFIETTVYSAEENQELLKLYEGLRVADVSDGLDMVGPIRASWIRSFIRTGLIWILSPTSSVVLR